MTIPDQEKFWDKVAHKKEFTTNFQIDAFEQYVSKTMVVLDVGCGYGRTLNELHLRGFNHLYGVDFSQEMINRGLTQHPHLKLVKNNNHVLPFADNTFHAVILIAVLTCIVEDEKQRAMLMEIKRVLKDTGILYINDFMVNQDRRNMARYEKFQSEYGTYGVFEIPQGGVLRHHFRDHIIELTRDFHELRFEPVVFTTMNGHRSNGFYFIGQCRGPKLRKKRRNI